MKIRYNSIFIPLLIICAIAVWYLGFREEKEVAASRLADRALVEPEQFDIIELISPDQTIRLEKVNSSDESWMMRQPFEAGCDPTAVNQLISAIFEASSQRDFTDVTEEQLAEYGLVDPKLRLRLASTDGIVLMDVAFGHENPSGAAHYARFTDKQASAFLVPIYHVAPFHATPNELRDSRAIAFKPEEVEAIQLSSSVADIHLRKEAENWMVTRPSSFPANPARVAILMQNLEELKAVEFLEEDASASELRRKMIEVNITTAEGTEKTLTLRGEDISRGILATSSTQPSPFVVEAYIHDRLALDPNVFFYTRLIDFAAEQIARVHVRQPGAENLEIERTGEGTEDWRILRPEDRAFTDPGDFENFSEALMNLQPEESAPIPASPEDYGLEPVYFMKIEVYRERNMGEATIYLGSKNDQGNYYATQDGNSYFTIAGGLVDDFISATIKLKGTAE